MKALDFYKGRPQTFLKHFLFEKYLEIVAIKVGMHSGRFVFVDAFAGPWRSQGGEFDDTSFRIAIDVLSNVQKLVRSKKFSDFNIRCLFIEKDPDAYVCLEQIVSNHPDLISKSLNGSFEDYIPEVKSFIKKDFSFLFVDPTGWQGFGLAQMRPLLTGYGEVLINFMFNHINRFIEIEEHSVSSQMDELMGGAGIQTAALAFGGYTGTAYTGATENYDGTNWTSNPTGLNTARSGIGKAGTQTAALVFGGNNPAATGATEEYDGSTWATSPGSLATARWALAGCGTQTAGLAFGGTTPPITNLSEEYNGSTWTNSPGNLNTARRDLAGAGTQTAGLAFGGTDPSRTGATEEYNGSTWTSSPGSLNTARQEMGSAGIQTAALAFGGETAPGNTGATELYDGTSWTTSPASLSTARKGLTGCGTQPSALAFGGETTVTVTNTEEFTITGTAGIKTITVS